MTKERRLGKGLAALLGTPRDEGGPALAATAETQPGGVSAGFSPRLHVPTDGDEPAVSASQVATHGPVTDGQMVMVGVYDIDENPFQPRREFNESEIAALAESLKDHDMLQPVLVRRVGSRWQLISGERRLRAAIVAGWSKIPARVRQADDRLVAELAIVENLQRKDLNPIEKALSFQRYLREHRCTQEDLGRRIKVDRSTIANLMRLLELPESIQADVRGGVVSVGHARALLPLGDEARQVAFAVRIREEGLSVRDVEGMVRDMIRAEDEDPLATTDTSAKVKSQSSLPQKVATSDQIAALEQQLRLALGTKVDIKMAGRGRGRIVVHFADHDEFERLQDVLTQG